MKATSPASVAPVRLRCQLHGQHGFGYVIDATSGVPQFNGRGCGLGRSGSVFDDVGPVEELSLRGMPRWRREWLSQTPLPLPTLCSACLVEHPTSV